MKFIDLFPTVILQETLNNISNKEIEDYKNFVQNINQINLGAGGMYTKSQKILENPIFNTLTNSILNISRNYLNELGHIFDDVQISTSWANILNKDTSIHNHVHSNAYICGVFYLHDSTSIVFQNPHVYNWKFLPQTFHDPKKFRKHQEYSITPLRKNIIIFPSWLEHKVIPTNQKERISIAFNIIPKGEFGPDAGKLYL